MQGFNMGRYVPPEVEGTISANKLNKKHALGSRASKLSSQGILTVRFEMPFPIWCQSCAKPTIIGQGVRFNAEKKRVGSYFTSAIWSFRFRHVECGGLIEMRTDPKNTAYVVVEGATKRDTGEDRLREGDAVIMTDQEREALRKNAFASLEKTIADREQLRESTDRIDGLLDASARQWDDPYAQNQRLRRAFRVGRKDREQQAVVTEELRDRMSLAIDLVPASEEDARRAALVDFAPLGEGAVDKALSKPLFKDAAKKPSSSSPAPPSKMLKAEKQSSRRKENLVSEIINNTRAAKDPFLTTTTAPRPSPRLPGVKRKRAADEVATANERQVSMNPPPKSSTAPAALVQYDSD